MAGCDCWQKGKRLSTRLGCSYEAVRSKGGNSCYCSLVCDQMIFCLEMHANKAKGSIQSKIDPFTSFTGLCETFSLPLRFGFFICASSMRFDLANLGSVEICRPLLNGGALRYLSIE